MTRQFAPCLTQGTRTEVRTFSIYDLTISVDEDLLTPMIERGLTKGWYERDEVDIARLKLVPGDRVIEMGSGLGVATLAMARIVGSENVRAFEANPRLVALGAQNAAGNGLGPEFENKVLFPRALAPASSMCSFHIADEFWASSVVPHKTSLPRTIEVPVGVLEDEIARLNANVLVMDIEGMEVEILETADLSNIEKMVFEIHYENRGKERTDNAVWQLVSRGYAIDLKLSSRGVLYLERITRP